MPTRRERIEAMLVDDPHDTLLRYGLAVEWEKEGMTVKVTRTIEEDGETRTDTLTSNYQPWRAVYLVGPGTPIPATPTPTPKTTP